jgi:hypothetical protein
MARSAVAALKANVKAERDSKQFAVAGVDLREELARYLRLEIFREVREARPIQAAWPERNGRAVRPVPRPELRVRRTGAKPKSLIGWARYDGTRIHIVDYPGITGYDVRETLLHEVVHAHGIRGHGARFRNILRAAAREAFGIAPVEFKNRFHGQIAALLKAAAEMSTKELCAYVGTEATVIFPRVYDLQEKI